MFKKVNSFLFSGFKDDPDTHRRLGVIYAFAAIPAVLLLITAILTFNTDKLLSGLLFFYLLLVLAVIPLLRLTRNIAFIENYFVALIIPVQLSRLIIGGEPRLALFLIIPWAVFAFLLAGRRMALFWIGLLVGVSLALAKLGDLGYLTIGYAVAELLQIYAFLLPTVLFLYLYGKRQELFQKMVMEERFRVEKEQERLHLLLESMSDGVVAIDRAWNIVLWNKAMSEMTGQSHKVSGHALQDVFTFTDEDSIENATFIETAMVQHRAVQPIKPLFLHIGKKKLPVSATASPVLDLAGKTTGAIILIHDLSEEKNMETAKSSIVSIVAHQIKTPLSIANWYLELLVNDKPKLTDQQQSFLKEITTASERITKLVQDLLFTVEAELGSIPLRNSQVDLAQSMRDTLDGLAPSIQQKNLKIKEEHTKLPHISADSEIVTYIYRVLLENAIAYNPKGGNITINHKVDVNKDEIITSIADDGIGIDPADKNKVFTKFFRSKKAAASLPSGTGLDLFTAKVIIESVGGRIWFESPNPGSKQGSTFFVALPLSGMKHHKK